jgi:transposase InsO family protein
MVCEELSICHTTLIGWLDKYQQDGYSGLEPMRRCDTGQDKLAAAITEEILALKEQHPKFGVRRISQWLRRWHLLPASPETVRDRLRQAGLMKSPSRKARKRNLTRPRFFERATPNQMWQSDIFTFRLGGKYAYLIAFLDDYSRFITGADLFRSPTAHAVIEVYRVGTGEYQPPKEMLTDNGRQYTSWRGVSRFEAELRKDRVAHIKSRPHHPMTLGKIERFWSSIWGEFLARAQFESFEQARERIKLWLKYYNHKRPHQGIGGLCPADRFFEIQSELKKTLEAGIQDNLLELALRGQPRAPFYMVGRMDNQSVVLHAETSTPKTPKAKTPKPPKPPLSAMDKVQAVLAVWTDRCKPSEVCRQLQVPWITFNHWQRRAMEGMLQALESRVNLSQGQALSPRLRALLQKHQQATNINRLNQRLEKVASKPPETKMG